MEMRPGGITACTDESHRHIAADRVTNADQDFLQMRITGFEHIAVGHTDIPSVTSPVKSSTGHLSRQRNPNRIATARLEIKPEMHFSGFGSDAERRIDPALHRSPQHRTVDWRRRTDVKRIERRLRGRLPGACFIKPVVFANIRQIIKHGILLISQRIRLLVSD